MPKTFSIEQSFSIKEPMFTRSRNPYRGSRSSLENNLEMNSLIVNFHRIKNSTELIKSTIDDLSKNLVGQVSSESIYQNTDDGSVYDLGDITVSIDEDEQDMTIDTLSRISGKLKRLESKIKKLESGN